jgi:hypothetical protein
MNMMNVLYEYDSLGLFEGKEKLWWRKTKPEEELYDTWEDPYELVNLADQPKYEERLKEMRQALVQWQEKYGDMGFIPEKELVEKFMPNGIQPSTEAVRFKEKGDSLILNCSTKGASIAYQYTNTDTPDHWLLYTGPLPLPENTGIRAQAIRIGYAHSKVSHYAN